MVLSFCPPSRRLLEDPKIQTLGNMEQWNTWECCRPEGNSKNHFLNWGHWNPKKELWRMAQSCTVPLAVPLRTKDSPILCHGPLNDTVWCCVPSLGISDISGSRVLVIFLKYRSPLELRGHFFYPQHFVNRCMFHSLTIPRHGWLQWIPAFDESRPWCALRNMRQCADALTSGNILKIHRLTSTEL